MLFECHSWTSCDRGSWQFLSVTSWNVGGFPHNLGGMKCFGSVPSVTQASHKILSWERSIDSTKKEKYLLKENVA